MQCENFPENGLCVSEDKPETKETVEATLECPEEMRVSFLFVSFNNFVLFRSHLALSFGSV